MTVLESPKIVVLLKIVTWAHWAVGGSEPDISVATFEALAINMCGLVIQVVSSTYEQIASIGRILLLKSKQCSKSMGVMWGFVGVSVDPKVYYKRLSLLYQSRNRKLKTESSNHFFVRT